MNRRVPILILAGLLGGGCGLTLAQDATIGRAVVNAGCTIAETIDPALESNNLVELICPVVPAATPEAGPSLTVQIQYRRVVVSRAAWRDTLAGTQVLTAPPADAGAGG